MESTGLLPTDVARIISPQMPKDGRKKCLQFTYNVFGEYVGKIELIDANGFPLWRFDGKDTRKNTVIKYSLQHLF